MAELCPIPSSVLVITVGNETVNAVTERILEAIPGILQPDELMFQAPNAPQTTED